MFRKLRDKTRPLRRRLKLGVATYRARNKRSSLICPVIGVTGSSGKSTTTNLLRHVLAGQGKVEALCIENTLTPLARFMAALPLRSDFVLAELGASQSGDILSMSTLLRPTVAVITKVGIEHYSSFRSREGVAEENGSLVSVLPENGLAILNADDPYVAAMSERTKARAVTFGWSEGADYQVLETRDGFPKQLEVTIRCKQGVFEVATPFLDSTFWLATAAAFACAVELGMEPARVAELIGSAQPIWNRLQTLKIPKGPIFLLDTVKAPAESIEGALAALGKASAKRKTVILGTISDYKGDSRKPYRAAYRLSRELADRVIFVGDHSHRSGATEEDIERGIFASFVEPRAATEYIRQTAQPDELILIKGSATQHLERIAFDWGQNVQCWDPRCGKTIDCRTCGLVEFPRHLHKRKRWSSRWTARYRSWLGGTQ